MKIYRKVKDTHGSRIYLLGLRVYELRKTAQENATYLFGVKIRSKRPKRLVDASVEEKVCFDLMYRDVPTIFYRFDSNLTYSNNMDNEAARAAADKDSELYNCFYTAEDTLHKIEHYIRSDFRIEESVRRRNNEIIWQRSNNCRRLLELTDAIPTS